MNGTFDHEYSLQHDNTILLIRLTHNNVLVTRYRMVDVAPRESRLDKVLYAELNPSTPETSEITLAGIATQIASLSSLFAQSHILKAVASHPIQPWGKKGA